jgi:hypothetical protein
MVNTHKDPAQPPFGPAPRKPPHAGRVLICSALLAATDFAFGPAYTIPVFFVLPVIWVAWYHSFSSACVLALSLTVSRFLCHWAWGFPVDWDTALANNVMRGVTLILVAFLTQQLAAQLGAVRKRLQCLESLLPICPDCGLACHQDRQWLPVHDGAPLSTVTPPKTLCPDCERKRYDLQSG